MPPELVCIGNTYADGKDMRMLCTCRCHTYGYVQPILFLLFLWSDPKKGKVGSVLINRMEGRTRDGRKGLKAKGRWTWKVRFERRADVEERNKSS